MTGMTWVIIIMTDLVEKYTVSQHMSLADIQKRGVNN